MYVLRMPFVRLSTLVLPLAVLLLPGCGIPGPGPGGASTDIEYVEPGEIPDHSQTVIVILGDSLTAGLGLLDEEAFPSRLQFLFAAEGYEEVDVINAGVSGDTTAGGLRRVDTVLAPNVRIAVIALGGNDALRGLSAAQTRENLRATIDIFLEAGVDVLLAGMEAPTNLGLDYRSAFRNTYADLAEEYRGRIRVVPFLLEGVAGEASLNQSDGIHPNAAGAQAIADHLYPTLRDMVDEQAPGPETR